tara:strand:+ start:221 stop:907 length:687 start_codon:yes stop_codon:yes gene_type:complete
MSDLIDTQIDEIVSSSIGFKLNRAEFVRGLQFVSEFVSKDKERPILCGVNLTVKKIDGEIALRLTATDSYKMGGYFLKVSDPLNIDDEIDNHFLLKGEDVKSLLTILKKDRIYLNEIAVSIHDKKVIFSTTDNDLITVVNLENGEFPNVEDHIPNESDFATKKDNLPNGINFGSDYLQKSINAFKKIKVVTVLLRFQDDVKPVFISPQSREDFEVEYPFAILMPVRCS